MPASTVAHVSPEVLRWARESVGYDAARAARAAGIFQYELELAESGQGDITLAQAEKLAELYDRPLAELFLPEPPAEETQEAAAELHELLERRSPWPLTEARLRQLSSSTRPAEVRSFLGVTIDEQKSWSDSAGYAALRAWIDALESLGVLVMQDGSLTVEEMRGFASVHETVPAIVLNTKDDPRARVFTAIHELGHLLRPDASEAWCNDFAGEVLIPTRELEEEFRAHPADDVRAAVIDLARAFSVTPHAAAVRLARTELVQRDEALSLIAFVRSRGQRPARSGGGGDFYRNKITWLGPAFVQLVLTAADSHTLPLSNAAGLLEAKVDQFGGLRQRLEERAEIG